MIDDFQLMDENSSASLITVSGVTFYVESIDGNQLPYVVSESEKDRIHSAIILIVEAMRGEKLTDSELKSFPQYSKRNFKL